MFKCVKIRQCSKKQLRINTNSEQRQGSGNDFRIFAINFVVELVFGQNPEISKFNEKKFFRLSIETKVFFVPFNKKEAKVIKELHDTAGCLRHLPEALI